MQGRTKIEIPSVDFGAVLHQKTIYRRVTRPVEPGPPSGIPVVDASSSSNQKLDDLNFLGKVQRARTVDDKRIHIRTKSNEKPGDGVAPGEERSVQRSAAVEILKGAIQPLGMFSDQGLDIGQSPLVDSSQQLDTSLCCHEAQSRGIGVEGGEGALTSSHQRRIYAVPVRGMSLPITALRKGGRPDYLALRAVR